MSATADPSAPSKSRRGFLKDLAAAAAGWLAGLALPALTSDEETSGGAGQRGPGAVVTPPLHSVGRGPKTP